MSRWKRVMVWVVVPVIPDCILLVVGDGTG